MFAYCRNNPVMCVDYTGELPEFIEEWWSQIVYHYYITQEINTRVEIERVKFIADHLVISGGVGTGVEIPGVYEVAAEEGFLYEDDELKTGEFGGNNISLSTGILTFNVGNSVYRPHDGRANEYENYFNVELVIFKPSFRFLIAGHIGVSIKIFEYTKPYD